MRPGWRAFLGTVLAMALFFTNALARADEITQTIASRNLATFDDPATAGNWIVQGSKYATKDFPQFQLVRAWPEALYGKNRDNKNLFALGIHGRFDRKSYNYIEIIPAAKDSAGKLQPASIPLPGRAQSIDMWVWGANYNFWLDAHIRDYEGIDHVIHMGSLLYAGWRDLTAAISTAIPQARKYIPRYAGLELTKLVIWTAPDEKVDDFYFFIDEISVLTDLFETRFDGEDLADPATLNNIWQQGTK
ncbi:MAG: flagellar filament outer layer protein FlaA [Spirochaetia bacterium]|jgi:hypothetical protein